MRFPKTILFISLTSLAALAHAEEPKAPVPNKVDLKTCNDVAIAIEKELSSAMTTLTEWKNGGSEEAYQDLFTVICPRLNKLSQLLKTKEKPSDKQLKEYALRLKNKNNPIRLALEELFNDVPLHQQNGAKKDKDKIVKQTTTLLTALGNVSMALNEYYPAKKLEAALQPNK